MSWGSSRFLQRLWINQSCDTLLKALIILSINIEAFLYQSQTIYIFSIKKYIAFSVEVFLFLPK